MALLPVRPLPSTCQGLRSLSQPMPLFWRKNGFCVPAFDPFSNFSISLTLSYARLRYSPEATRRISNYRDASRIFEEGREGSGNYEDEEEFDDDEEDRSLDLLVRFVQNIFKKISRRARKAARSVLPSAISSQLVGFSVNGLIILTFLWILKAFLEVMCTLGSAVFVAILLLRGVWSTVTYIKINGKSNRLQGIDDNSSWSGAQPAT
eukprot:Gb_39755 [translate_table: standard]